MAELKPRRIVYVDELLNELPSVRLGAVCNKISKPEPNTRSTDERVFYWSELKKFAEAEGFNDSQWWDAGGDPQKALCHLISLIEKRELFPAELTELQQQEREG